MLDKSTDFVQLCQTDVILLGVSQTHLGSIVAEQQC